MPPPKKPHHIRAKTFIAEWRKAARLTQVQAAKRLDVEQSTISKWETGDSPYEQDFLERLATLYKTTPDALISRRPGEQYDNDGDREKANAARVRTAVRIAVRLARHDLDDDEIDAIARVAEIGLEQTPTHAERAPRHQGPLPKSPIVSIKHRDKPGT